MPAHVRLQLLLRSEHRNPTDVDRAAALARSIGLSVTGTGAATVSAIASQEALHGLFGSQDAHGGDALPVPAELEPLIESVTVPPPHQYL